LDPFLEPENNYPKIFKLLNTPVGSIFRITKNPFSKSHRRLGLEKLTFLGVCCEQPSMAAFLNSIPVTVINLAGFVLTAIYICIFYTYSDTNQRVSKAKPLKS